MRTFLRILSVISLISWMGLIFYLSAQNATQSSALSGGLIKTLAQTFYSEFENLNVAQQQALIESLQGIVRTLAHYFIYVVLGFFSFLSLISYANVKIITRTFWMFAIGAFYAVSDEIHQNFVTGRSMQLVDIGVDWLGVMTALLICWIFVINIRPLYRKVKYMDKNKELVELTNQLYKKLDDSLRIKEQLEIEIEKYKEKLKNHASSIAIKEAKIERVEEDTEKIEIVLEIPKHSKSEENPEKTEIAEKNNLLYEVDDENQIIENTVKILTVDEIEEEGEAAKEESKLIEIKKETAEALQPINEVVNSAKEVTFEEDFSFAASIIGKTVITATSICNELSIKNTEESHELVNLILGRTEILKSEILKILKSDTDLKTKKQLIISEQDSAYDYFNSIKAQIS